MLFYLIDFPHSFISSLYRIKPRTIPRDSAAPFSGGCRHTSGSHSCRGSKSGTTDSGRHFHGSIRSGRYGFQLDVLCLIVLSCRVNSRSQQQEFIRIWFAVLRRTSRSLVGSKLWLSTTSTNVVIVSDSWR